MIGSRYPINRPHSNPLVLTRLRTTQRFVIDLGPTEPVGNTGLSAHLTLSPDGRRLVYAAEKQGTSQLYVRPIEQLEAQVLPGTEGAAAPFFSPDGESVAFYSRFSDLKLKKVRVHGGPPQVLADAPLASGGAWRTQDTVVFSTWDAGYQSRSLYSVSAGGGTPERLLAGDAENGYVWPEVLPGGRAVLFTIRPSSRFAREGRIAVLTLETREQRDLIHSAFYARYAPTGHIVFARAGALWAVPFDPEQLRTMGPELRLVEGVQMDTVFGGAAYAFSQNGLLVFAPGSIAPEAVALAWVDREGGEDVLAAEPRWYFDRPRISPDGRHVALEINDAHGNWDIWIYDLVGGKSHRLTFDPGRDETPLWTPSGERVVFYSSRNGGGLFWKATDGSGQPERLTTSQNRKRPESFSLDGDYLVVAEGHGSQGDLHLLSLEDGAEQTLWQTEFVDERDPAISPDGDFIAYASNQTGEYEIYVRPFPNVEDGVWQVSAEGSAVRWPRWGPSGKELFYVRQNGDAMMAVAIETEPSFRSGKPEALFRGNYTSLGYDVSPDGRRFLMFKDTQLISEQTWLVVVNNWFEELVRLAPPAE